MKKVKVIKEYSDRFGDMPVRRQIGDTFEADAKRLKSLLAYGYVEVVKEKAVKRAPVKKVVEGGENK